MSNENETGLTRYTALPMNGMSDLQKLGEVIAQSGMFGAKNTAEGVVIAAMCHQDGVSFSKWMQSNHMIAGKVSKRADAMLADLMRLGGTYKVLSRSSESASISFKFGDSEYTSTLAWKDALDEPFVYFGREDEIVTLLSTKEGKAKLSLKPKYATPRSRMQMLWSRVVSDGVRTVCPMAVQGVYAPEEVEDFTEHEVAVPAKDVVLDAEFGDPKAEAKPETAKPAPKPVVADDEPKLDPSAVVEADYSRCPEIEGHSLSGQPWAEIPTSRLEKALTATTAAITAMHRAAIQQVLASRSGK